MTTDNPQPALAVIPARFASVRFPGKPLADDTGKPLIQHVVERVRLAKRVDRVVVATDDRRIFDAVRAFGGEAVMTGEHPNGTSRLAEAVRTLGTGHELIVNVQGDEPEVPAETIDALIAGLAEDAEAQMATLASPFAAGEDADNPNIVKLVLDRHDRALYFSRALIPHDRDAHRRAATPGSPGDPGSSGGSNNSGCSASLDETPGKKTSGGTSGGGSGGTSGGISGGGVYKHPGLYAYRRAFLEVYPTLEATPLEQAEKLEQLRVLEHGFAIKIVHAPAPHPGIDTPEQYAAFVQRVRDAHAARG